MTEAEARIPSFSSPSLYRNKGTLLDLLVLEFDSTNHVGLTSSPVHFLFKLSGHFSDHCVFPMFVECDVFKFFLELTVFIQQRTF